MIEIKGLTKKFGKMIAVCDVNLKIEDNECFALLGLNGAGKTTLINVLSTQMQPTSGTAEINGFDLSDKKEIRKIINISPQETAVAKNLTVKENLKLMATLYDVENKEEKIESIIKEFKLEEKQNVLCKKLSGGQMRRVSLAIAILTQPKILFLDEPTLGLDVKARKLLWDEIARLKNKMTIILTTHYLEEVESLADRVSVISKGKIKAVGTVLEIKQQTNTNSLEEAFLKLSEEEIWQKFLHYQTETSKKWCETR